MKLCPSVRHWHCSAQSNAPGNFRCAFVPRPKLFYHFQSANCPPGCWNRCRLNPQTNPAGVYKGTHDRVNNNGVVEICARRCVRPLRVKLGIVNMSRQLSGEPSFAHDAFIYHADSAAYLHPRCRLLPYSAAAAASAVTIATTYPGIQHVFFFIPRFS